MKIRGEKAFGRGGGGGRGGGRGQGQGGGRQQGGRGLGPGGECLCPNCGHKAPHKRGVPCYKQKCPECGTTMTRSD